MALKFHQLNPPDAAADGWCEMVASRMPLYPIIKQVLEEIGPSEWVRVKQEASMSYKL